MNAITKGFWFILSSDMLGHREISSIDNSGAGVIIAQTRRPNEKEDLANARAISAVPELLAFAEAMAAYFKIKQGIPMDLMVLCHNALNKVRVGP